MAVSESIKGALTALEDEAAWASNLAQCFVVAAAGPDGLGAPPWVLQFERVVQQLGDRVEALSMAINRS